jgi:small-conductance mechanosensitive channel
MIHRLLRLLAVVAVLLGGGLAASAQTPNGIPAGAPPAGPAPTAPATASPDEIRQLVATLDDPAARARLIGALTALLATQQQPAPAAPATPADWVGRVIGQISDGMALLSAETAETGRMAREWPYAMRWLAAHGTDADAQRELLDLVGRLIAVLVGAGLVEWLVALLLAQPRRLLDQWGAHSAPGRALLLLARVIGTLLPIAAFIGAAYIILPLTAPDQTTRLVVIAVINANVLVRAILAAARRVLAPAAGGDPAGARPRRLIRLDDDGARRAFRWLRRLSWVAIYGWFLISAAALLGVPHSMRDLLSRGLGLVLAVMLVALIFRYRDTVRRQIAGAGARDGQALDEWRLLRVRLAEIWHVLAACYVMGVFLVWALAIPNGFAFLASGSLWTAATLALLRAAYVALRWLGLRTSRALTGDPHATTSRAQSYLPLANAALRVFLAGLAAVGILQAWGIDVWDGLTSPIGHRILSSAFSIAVILAVAVAFWEIAAIMIARSLALGAADDSPRQRAARLRTLLPLLRNALSIVIVVLTTLVVLSELGIDIAPLLAGAGVVGLAIGFGAQTLVKDVITGLFFLLEDTVNVGDVVDVGGGRSGLVEGMSIRSIRLRDLDGSVHTVPFSAVAAIKNMTKDFGYYVIDAFVDYRSSLERALELMRAIDEAMRADKLYGPMILAPAEIMGVDRFADNAVVARLRIKTVALRRWDVGREFNRRLKREFDDAGIGMVAAVPPPTPAESVPAPAA